MWTKNFQMYKLDSKKVEKPKIVANIHWIMLSLWLCGSQQTVENS